MNRVFSNKAGLLSLHPSPFRQARRKAPATTEVCSGFQGGTVTTLLVFWLLLGMQAFACGPFWEEPLLLGGDRALLTLPAVEFREEMRRMGLEPSNFVARNTRIGTYRKATADVELEELLAALEQSGMSSAEAQSVCAEHALARDLIVTQFGPELSPSLQERQSFALVGAPIVNGLPAEFATYFRGSVAWHLGRTEVARGLWEDLLAQPPDARHFKSTWAAFMIAKSWEETRPDRAMQYYQRVRQLASEGYGDGLGLAAASLGYEARLQLRAHHYSKAMDFYLEQYRTGDLSAALSLRFTADKALEGKASGIRRLVRKPEWRKVVMAYLLSGGWRSRPVDVDHPVKESMLRWLESQPKLAPTVRSLHRRERPAERWLEAMEETEVKDVIAAERMAWVAYQLGKVDLAKRWLSHSGDTQLSKWLTAKLALRDGDLDLAYATLRQLVQEFPVADGETPVADSSSRSPQLLSATRERYQATPKMNGELGVLLVQRGRYVEAMDLLLRSGHWDDAAYVAEQVLTVEELQDYVDRYWPKPAIDADNQAGGSAALAHRLRYLLGRRLYRIGQTEEAKQYYPAEVEETLSHYEELLQDAQDPLKSEVEQGRALFAAACWLRHEGMEMVGTEVGPDWMLHEGSYTYGVTLESRGSLSPTNRVRAESPEIDRATRHRIEPHLRFHYTYIAVNMAWEAALLLPDQSDETARVLCLAGSWIKDRHPQEADVFYKALVRRCDRTELGALADARRWFPRVNAKGNLERSEREKLGLGPAETDIPR